MPRRRREHEPENHERWLVSYADFITLLFAFFVVMYSVSSVNEGKFRVLSDSMVATFKDSTRSLKPIQVGQLVRSPYVDKDSIRTSPVVIDPGLPRPLDFTAVPDPFASAEATPQQVPIVGAGNSSEELFNGAGLVDESVVAPIDESSDKTPGSENVGDSQAVAVANAQGEDAAMRGIDEVAEQVEDAMATLIDQELVEIRRGEDWLEVEFKTSILFASGQARLASEAIPMLGEIASILKEFPNPVQVEGFTDNIPIRTVAYPTNWELSASRAASVVNLFMKYGVRPERMVAIGYGEFRPIGDNTTAVGRAKNRRVILVIPAQDNSRDLLDLQRISSTASVLSTGS